MFGRADGYVMIGGHSSLTIPSQDASQHRSVETLWMREPSPDLIHRHLVLLGGAEQG